MGGGRNGRFCGAPIFGQNPVIFAQKDAQLGRPNNGRPNHHPSHPPLDTRLDRTNIFHPCFVGEGIPAANTFHSVIYERLGRGSSDGQSG